MNLNFQILPVEFQSGENRPYLPVKKFVNLNTFLHSCFSGELGLETVSLNIFDLERLKLYQKFDGNQGGS